MDVPNTQPSYQPDLRQLDPTIPTGFRDGIFYGFDVDEDSRDFLVSLVTSGNVPKEELAELYHVSLTSGCEDWDSLIQCASSLRDRVLNRKFGAQLSPYLGIVQRRKDEKYIEWLIEIGAAPDPLKNEALEWKEEKTAKKPRATVRSPAKSPFWDSPEENNSTRLATKAENGSSGPDQDNPGNISKLPVAGPAKHLDSNSDQGPEEEEPAHPRATDRDLTGAVSSTQTKTRKRKRGGDDDSVREISPPTRSKRRHINGSTSGHYNPPVDATSPSDKLRPAPAADTTHKKPSKQKRTKKDTTSYFFDTPTSTTKIEDARTASGTANSSPIKKLGRPARNTVSALPIPPLSAERFGLIQEELAHDPFRLLVAITFLIRTPGRVAIPVFRELMERYPTPRSLLEADPGYIIPLIHDLGLSTRRCETIQKYARLWMEQAPSKFVRYGVKNYPRPGDGKDVRLGEKFGPEEPGNDVETPDEPMNSESALLVRTKARGFGTAWEIGHLTQGKYAIDSWRIFCRDALLNRAEDWKGKGRGPEFQPEWMRVLPEDKELRACLRWMWMREGWEWNPLTGEREVLREEMRKAVDEGRVAYDNDGQLQILEIILDDDEGHEA